MWRKLILFGCLAVMLGIVSTNAALGGMVHIQVAADSDDAEQEVVSGNMDLTSSDLEFMYDHNVDDPSDEQLVGIRFENVQIPKGEIIARAYVRFDADDVDNDYHAGEVHALIQGQLDPNPATFEDIANNISARARTAAQVPWSPARWTEPTHQQWWTSDIASVIQEIVDQEGWAAGNALVLIVSQDPANPSTGDREAESFNGAGGNEPRRPVLVVEFGAAPTPYEEIYLEAESADVLGSSWRVYDDAASSGGQHIGSENGDGDDNSAAPGAEWVAVYNFEAVGGLYKVLLRGQEIGSDSFWVRIPGATAQSYEHPDQAGTGWVRFNGFDADDGVMAWDVVHSDDNDKDMVYFELPPGAHTIEVAKREDGVLFDSLIITNDLAFEFVSLPGAGASDVDIRIADGGDDAEQHLNDGRMDIGSSDLEIPYEDGGTPTTDEQVIGLRFPSVVVGKGGTVANAYIEIEVDKVDKEGSQAPVNVIIEGELSANAAPIEDVANNLTDRAVTAAKVKWTIPEWTEQNAKYRSPDISSIIREITSQDDWSVGNTLMLIIRDDKDNPSTGLREAESYDGESGAAPLLHLLTVVPLAKDPSPADGATGISIAPPLKTYVSSDVPKAVPDRSFRDPVTNLLGEAVSTLNVPDSLKIKDLNIELDITMPGGNNADLNVYLKSPDNKQVTLFEDVGLNSSNFTNTILDDEASTSISKGRGPFTGKYKPEGKLRDFDGRNAQGTWQLKIIDDWYQGTATLNSWQIVIQGQILISWLPPGGAATQNLYFADNFEDVNSGAALVGNLAGNVKSYDVGALALGQTYYWRVDSVDAAGKPGAAGPIWSFTTASGNAEVDIRIVDGDDDVEERPTHNGDLDVTSSDIELAYEDTGQGDPQTAGLRFVDVGVPAGADVLQAYLEFEVDETKGGTDPVNVLIKGQLSPDAEPFVDEPFNVTNRTFTTAVVPWSVPDFTAADEKFQTPDISAIIVELINQDGWAGGNAMVLTVADDPCNPSLGVRCTESYDGEASAAPRLVIIAISESASLPSPANGAIDVPLDTVLAWNPGFSTVERKVYFGTSSSPGLLGLTTGISASVKLAPSTTYYWKVDEIEANGTVHAGTVWSFTTPAGEATEPSPADFAAGVPLDTVLSWTPGITAVSHDVFFGTSSPPAFIGNQTETTFDPNGLTVGAVYYWRVDEIGSDGVKYIGDTWMLKAPREGTGTILYELWDGIGSADEVSALTGHPDYPYNPTSSTELSSFDAPVDRADEFGGRIHGWLHPDTSGDYTFWIATDDESELWLSTDETPGNAVLISQVTDWADHLDFDDGDVVPSGPIALEGGKKYYIMALYKEGGGGDNCAVAWQGPDSPERSVISGYFLSPFVALWPENPSPAEGAVLEQKFALLEWIGGATAASFDVYVSDSLDDVAGGTEAAFAGNLTDASLSIGMAGGPLPDGLAPGTTYYWRVDAVEADPNVVYAGPVWSFWVMSEKAYDANPADGAVDVATGIQLSWAPGMGALLHYVYFGDDHDTVANATGALPLPLLTYNPGALEPGKTYYWRIDEFSAAGVIKGDVWSFTTAP